MNEMKLRQLAELLEQIAKLIKDSLDDVKTLDDDGKKKPPPPPPPN